MSWKNIRGHEAQVDHFRKLLTAGRLPHALLFVGPPSVGKTLFARAGAGLLHDFFGLTVSRAGLLGHLRWGGTLFEPVVEELLQKLRNSPVVQADV